MPTQAQKGAAFKALHDRDNAFIIPNPWDVGTARLLQGSGFEALATTSAGFAFSVGKPDGGVDRDTMLAHAAAIAAATDLPVSADLEDGYAVTPDEVADTVRRAAAAGLAGCSIEDVARGRAHEPYDIETAAARVKVAAAAAHSQPFPFTLTARAENFIVGRPDLRDTIARLRAYEDAGADVLFAPGLSTRDEIAEVIRCVKRPLNVIMGLSGVRFSLDDLSALGVKRVSVGSSLARTALGAFVRAMDEMRTTGTFDFADTAVKGSEMNAAFAKFA
jgi:2-methylisocitrate lyase-like PEP mutase family enzyme